MADLINLTQQPVRYVTSAGFGLQPIFLAVDVGSYDMLDVEAGVIANEGGVTTFSLDLYTAMQQQTDDGWLPVASSLLSTATANTWAQVRYQGGLLRYVRWCVSSISGGTAVTFFIRGLARRFLAEGATAAPQLAVSQTARAQNRPAPAGSADTTAPWPALPAPAATSGPSLVRPLRPDRSAGNGRPVPRPGQGGWGGVRVPSSMGSGGGRPYGSGSGGLHLPTGSGPWRGPRSPHWPRR